LKNEETTVRLLLFKLKAQERKQNEKEKEYKQALETYTKALEDHKTVLSDVFSGCDLKDTHPNTNTASNCFTNAANIN